jgi:hypothetical protein
MSKSRGMVGNDYSSRINIPSLIRVSSFASTINEWNWNIKYYEGWKQISWLKQLNLTVHGGISFRIDKAHHPRPS